MEPVDFPSTLAESRVAIIGLGLMGGSLALALKGVCRQLLAVDPDPATRALALQRQIVDQISALPQEILPQADIIVLAAPVLSILKIISELPDQHPGAALVLDLGSTKRQICQALSALPLRFDPLGGHPMCGKETASLAHAEATLYCEAPFALVPLPRTTLRGRALALELVQAVGAQPLWLDAETHDRWVAATSHLPHLLASALAQATPIEAAPLVGPGFRSTSRLAAGSIPMLLDILATNTDYVLAALDRFRGQLDTYHAALASDDHQQLGALLASAATARHTLAPPSDPEQSPGGEPPCN